MVDGMSGAGVRVARRAVAYVRTGVDSAMESRLRMLLVLAGFPEPEVNVILRDLSGDWSRRFDLCYLALRLIIEYDGEQHGDLDHRDSDIHRREELERLGYTLVQVTSRGIYGDPARTLRRVADALRQAGGHAPGRWRPEWRHTFPGVRGRRWSTPEPHPTVGSKVDGRAHSLDGTHRRVNNERHPSAPGHQNPPPSQQRTSPERARPPEPTAESETAETRSDGRHRSGPGHRTHRFSPVMPKHAGRETAAGSGAQPTAGWCGLQSQKPDSSRRRRQRSSILSMKVPSEEVPWGALGRSPPRVGALVPTCCHE